MKISAIIFDLDKTLFSGNSKILEGIENFMEDLGEGGIQTALTTSNTWEITEKALEKIGFRKHLDAITTVEEAIYDKPEPHLFTLTAEKLAVEREDCLILTDSSLGLEAGKRAGMKTIVISDGEEGNFSKADMEVESISEITPKLIEGL